jgi:predicted transcriptional regulator
MPEGSHNINRDEVLSVFGDASDPVLTAEEVGDELDVTRQGAYYHLQNLQDSGRLERKCTGRDVVWWLPGQSETVSK